MQVIFQRNDLTILQLIINKCLLSLIYVQVVNNMAFPDLPWRVSHRFLLSKMHKFTLHHISHWTYLCLFSSLHMGQDLLLVLGWLKKKIFLNCISCLQLHNRLTYECSDIFLCTHTPSNDLLTKNDHLKIIKIQRRLPNSDQIAPCNQRSHLNKRPSLWPK